MSWTINTNPGSTYEQPPTGPQAAVLTRLIDIGTHTDVSPQYGETRRRQVIFMWELDEKMASGEPYTIQKFYTLSMHEKSTMRKDLESWRGKAFGDNETFDIGACLGKSALLNVGETQNGKSKITGLSRLPKGMNDITPRGPLLMFRIDDPDWSVFEQLSEFHRGKIESSEEYAGLKTHGQQQAEHTAAAATENNGPGYGDDFDDDIPF